MPELTHTDAQGNASMVDVSHKPPQRRMARATGHIQLAPDTVRAIADNELKKGDVLTVAQIAGIQAAKETPSLIPLCHTIALGDNDIFQIFHGFVFAHGADNVAAFAFIKTSTTKITVLTINRVRHFA